MKLEAETHDLQDEIPIRVQPEELEDDDDDNDDNDDNVDEEEEEEKEEEEDEEGRKDGRVSSGGNYRKLATIVAVVAILLGFVISTYQNTQLGKPKVIYANRYSKEHKFRPAASPVVTETLRDGRVRIRGAEATMSSPPMPTTTPQRKRKRPKQRTTRRKTSHI